MKYFNTETMAFVIPGIHGGKKIPNMIDRDIPTGIATEDNEEKGIKKGDKTYTKRSVQDGFIFEDLPDSWIQLEDEDERCKGDLSKNLVYVQIEGSEEFELKLIDKPGLTQEQLDLKEWNIKKADRSKEVNSISVSVDGMEFDGNETAQERMSRAIVASNDNTEQTYWKLANNEIVIVTALQLKQALRLAGEAQTAIWSKYK